MAIRYTHKENADMLAPLTLQAYMVGLIQPDEKLVYEKGGRGTATVIRLVKRNPDGTRVSQMRPQWVPEFGYKDGPSVVGNALVNVSNVLYSFERMKQETAKEITDVRLWVTGTDEQDARESLIWEDEASAQEAAQESGDSLNVYNVTARINWATISA